MTQSTSADLAKLLHARYGQTPGVADALNETIETLLGHRSVRAYADKAIPANTIELMMAAAQSASTSSNLQTWSVVAVTDPDSKERLSQFAGNQAWIRNCPVFLVWVADLARLESLSHKRGVAAESLNYLEMLLMGTIDASLAAQNATVAAESLGLGVVYIGGMRNKPEEVAKELGLPPKVFATFGMCIGYPDPEKPAAIRPRLPQSAILHHGKYDAKAFEAATDSYNAIMEVFYQEQKMKPQGEWDLHSLNRVRGPEALTGRDRLAEALKNLGFEMR
jgi:nitroreductase